MAGGLDIAPPDVGFRNAPLHGVDQALPTSNSEAEWI